MSEISKDELERRKKFMKRYRRNAALVKRLELRVQAKQNQITKVKTSNYSAMPRGGQPVELSDLISDRDELDERVKRLKAKGRVLRQEIAEKIDELDDPRLADVLEYYCLDCMTIESIAEEMGYTSRHVYELYTNAFSYISLEDH